MTLGQEYPYKTHITNHMTLDRQNSYLTSYAKNNVMNLNQSQRFLKTQLSLDYGWLQTPGGGTPDLLGWGGGGGGATGPKISWGILRVKSRIWRAYWENFRHIFTGVFAILRYKDIHCTQTMYLGIAGSTYYSIPYLNRRLLGQSSNI